MEELIERLENIAQKMVDDGRLFGATVGVVNFKNQKEIASVGQVGTGEFADDILSVNHIYDLASLTKLYTTMRYLQLFKSGTVTPETTVQSILPTLTLRLVNCFGTILVCQVACVRCLN